MSTTVYRDGILATDRILQNGNAYEPTDDKIRIVGNRKNEVIAMTGNFTVALRFIDWYESGKEDGKFNIPSEVRDPAFTAVIAKKISKLADPAGIGVSLEYWNTGVYPLKQDPRQYHAEGAGHEFALGAMHQGATAIEAVQAANHHCVHSAFGYLAVNLNKKKLEIIKGR